MQFNHSQAFEAEIWQAKICASVYTNLRSPSQNCSTTFPLVALKSSLSAFMFWVPKSPFMYFHYVHEIPEG